MVHPWCNTSAEPFNTCSWYLARMDLLLRVQPGINRAFGYLMDHDIGIPVTMRAAGVRRRHDERTSTQTSHPSDNVLRLIIPDRGCVHLRPEPARVIPLCPRRDVGTRRGPLLPLAGIAMMLAVALVALAITLRSGTILPSDLFVVRPWW